MLDDNNLRMKIMKIFLVCNKLCFGGAEKVGVMIANGLAERGHEVSIVADLFRPQTYSTNKQVQLLSLFTYKSYKIVRWISALFVLRRYLLKYRPQKVIGITESCSLLALIAGIGLKIEVIETIHNSFERPKDKPMPLSERILKFYVSKLFPCVTVLTESDKRVIGGRLKNVIVMPNPLSLEPAAQIPHKDKIILAAGRLEACYTKGFDLLIQAWGKIAKSYPNWQLLIAGYGTEKQVENFNKLVQIYGCASQVKLLGFQKNMKSLYDKASIFVLSSRYEGFGMVLIEAMSQGCACIACDNNGRQKEIIKNDSEGLICPTGKVSSLKEALVMLIENKSKRLVLQRNAIERSKAFDNQAIISRWEALLSQN